jgi:hypothetical protein
MASSFEREAVMTSKTLVNLVLAASLCGLGAGLFATDAQGRGRPPGSPPPCPPPPGAAGSSRIVMPPPLPAGTPGGYEEPGKYQMGVARTHYGSSTWAMPSTIPSLVAADGVRRVGGAGGIAAPTHSGAGSGTITLLQSLGTGTSNVRAMLSDEVAGHAPAGLSASQKFLKVHFGEETFLVEFQSDEERRQYKAELQALLGEMGLEIRHKER